ncbi:MAG: PIN domain-containing protein [Pyrinomonadaceae bacterium]
MNEYVVDTHTLFWYMTASPRLSAAAKAAFDEGINNLALIYIPSIVLAELYFLNVKHNYPIDFAAEYKKLETGGQFVLTSFEPSDVLDFDADSAVKEMHDKIVVGVSRRLNAACITKDNNIIDSSSIKIIW